MPGETPLDRTIRACRGAFLWLALFSASINVLMLTAPLYMLQVFDRVLASRSSETLLVLTLIAGVALLTLAALDGVRSFLLIHMSRWIDHGLGGVVLDASLRDALGHNGERTAQGLRDLATFRGYVTGGSVFALLDTPFSPLFVAVVFLLSPTLGWLAVIGALILIALAWANELSTRALLTQASDAHIAAMSTAEASIRNADTVEAMGMRPAVGGRWRRHQDEAVEFQARASARSAIISAATKFVRLVLQVGMLGAGAWLVIDGQLTPGGMIASTILLGRALAPIDQMINAWKGFVGARGAYARLAVALADSSESSAAPAMPRPLGHLKLDAATFAHPGSTTPAIKQLTFELAAGKSLGIVGPTAAGKSTLARMLVGILAPSAGGVRLDGIDLATWAAADRGQYIGFVPQDVELFSGTVSENIARMGDGSSAAVVEAAQLAGVHDLVTGLPDGYDTHIGTDGLSLSGGQRQRVALARALFGKPALVVMDEPNAHLDQPGLAALVGALETLKARETTVVIVAHQPSVVQMVDYLMVLGDGAIQMAGPTQEVLAKLGAAQSGAAPSDTAQGDAGPGAATEGDQGAPR